MDLTIKKASVYYAVTVLFSWTCWIAAMLYAAANRIPLLFNEGVYSILTDRSAAVPQIWLFVSFTLAAYGPIIGRLAARKTFHMEGTETDTSVRDRNYLKWLALIFLYPLVVFGTAVLVSFFLSGFSKPFNSPTMPLSFLLVFFLFQLFTSGLEEIGWRGHLQPVLQKKYPAEKACLLVGILWSVWHYPLLVYMNWNAGLFFVVFTLAGYTMLTIPQAYVLGFLYNSTKSLVWCIVLHAWANTVSAYLLVVSPLPDMTPIFVAVIVWLIAEFLVKKYGKDHLSTV